MIYDKIPEDLIPYIAVNEQVFSSLPEEAQQAIVNGAILARDAVQAERKMREHAEEWSRVMGTPHVMTPSLSEMVPTQSENSIRASKEFMEFRRSIEGEYMSGKMSIEEVERKVDLFINEKKKEGDARRKRDKKRTAKKVVARQIEERVGKSEHVGFMSKRIHVEDLYDDQVFVDSGFEVTVRYPFRSYLDEQITQMVQEFRARNTSIVHPIFTATVNAYFTASHRHPSYTYNVVATDANGQVTTEWYTRFTEGIFDKVRRYLNEDTYEEDVGEDMLNPSVTINLNVYEVRHHRKWWPDGVPRLLELDDFVLFTANDDTVDCKQQCVEYLGYTYRPELPFESNFDGKPVIVYQPFHLQMSQVRGFKDLMTSTVEAVPSTDCRDVIRIVMDGDHCAVIDSIKQSHKPRTKIVRKRFHLSSDEKIVEVFYDLETSRNGDTDAADPYLVCWSDDRSSDVHDIHYERDKLSVVERFVKMLRDTYDGEEIVLMAWYGSGFDHQLIIGEMKSQGGVDEIYLKDNHILYARIEFDGGSTVFHLKDPYKFISRKLADAASSFGVLNKGEFPHDVVGSVDDLERVYEKWFILRSEVVTESIGDHNKTKIVKTRYVREYMTEENRDTVLQKAIEYCKIDVLCCKHIWIKLKEIIHKEFGIHIRATTMTLPQLSIEMMQALLPRGVELYIPFTREDYDDFMKAQYGGRVVAKKGVYEERCVVLDVVSEYPTVMHDYDHPYGGYYRVSSIDWSKLGIYHVVLDGSTMTQEQRDHYSEFVPFKDKDDKLQYEWVDRYEGWFCTYDLLTAREEGYVIKCIEGYEWESLGKIFAPFIEAAKSLKQNGTGAVKFVGKILLNSGYGKLGQKPIDEDVYIVKKGIAQMIIDSIEDMDGKIVLGGIVVSRPVFTELDDKWDKMIVRTEGEVRYPTQNSVFILAAARRFLRQKMLEIKEHAPHVKVIYSDTDSMIIPLSSLKGSDGRTYDISSHLGKEFGQLSDDICGESGLRPYEVVIAGRKMYGYLYNDHDGLPRQVIHLKGVPTNMCSLDDMKHILKDEGNEVRYNMMTMRRNITNVKMLDIVKRISESGVLTLRRVST